jgi:phospholipid/cholesterol/gamma-HCH transport system permease protein
MLPVDQAVEEGGTKCVGALDAFRSRMLRGPSPTASGPQTVGEPNPGVTDLSEGGSGQGPVESPVDSTGTSLSGPAAMLGNKNLSVHLESVASPPAAPVGRFDRRTVAALSGLGAAAALAWACLRAIPHPRIYLPLTFAQVWEIGLGSLPLVLLVAMISGAVTSEQTGYQYSSTLPPWIAGSVITASVVTELGPLSTGFVLVGRVGARIGAELGAMSVTEQIQALRTVRRDPVLYLVLPRVLAALIAVPALVALADAAGMLAGWAVALVRIPITTSEFAAGARAYFEPFVLYFSLLKGAVFGVSIAFIACAAGLRATGGAAGVGRATTVSVVVATVVMMVWDLLLARLLRVFG